METPVERVRRIAKNKKIAIMNLEKQCGFSNGYLNPKKATTIPYEKAVILASALDTTAEYILSGTTKKPATADGDGLSESDMELVDMVMRIPPEKREALRTVLQALSEDGEVFPSGDH